MLTCRQQRGVDIVNIKKADEDTFYIDNCTLLRYYAAYSGYSVPNFGANNQSRLHGLRNPRRNPAILRCAVCIEEDGTSKLSRNVGKELPLYAA